MLLLQEIDRKRKALIASLEATMEEGDDESDTLLGRPSSSESSAQNPTELSVAAKSCLVVGCAVLLSARGLLMRAVRRHRTES